MAAPYVATVWSKMSITVCWAEVEEAQLTGPELIQETTEKIVLIKQRMQAAQDRQKSYADRNESRWKFEIGDRVMLKVSPWKGVVVRSKIESEARILMVKVRGTLGGHEFTWEREESFKQNFHNSSQYGLL
ncbi:hypothetical protein Tco_1300869 [Tanacetum coccineum]